MTRRHLLFAALALVLLTTLAYLPVLSGHAGYIWDDSTHVTRNVALHDGQGLVDLWAWGPRALFDRTTHPATQQYYPVTFTSFWLEYQFWGNRPWGYHIDNVLLHLLSAFLIWTILRRLGFRHGVAFFAAALFAVHPVNVESVAWVSERKNTLSLAFYLLSALLWMRWNRLDETAAAASPSHRQTRDGVWLFWATLLFVFALLSKSVTVTLPIALLAIAWWKRGTLRRVDILGTLPLLIVGAFAALLTITIETSNAYIGAYGPDFAFTFSQRCLIAGRAIWFYIAKLLDPLHLMFIYPRWSLDTASIAQWLAPIGIALALILLWALRKKIGRAPFAIAALFMISLAPALGFINFYPMQFSFVADHFQYIATIAICVAIAVILAALVRRIHPDPTLAAILAAVPLLTLAALSFRQATIYHDEQTLYRATLAANPDAWMASENLAVLLVTENGEKSYHEVVELYQQTIAKNPRDAKAFNALAGTQLAMRDYPEAEATFRQALALQPNDAAVEAGLGAALLLENKFDEATAHYAIACTRNPGNPEFLAGYGNAFLHNKHPVEAENQFRAALALHDGSPATYHYYLGLSLRDQGKLGPAIEAFRQSITLDPKRPEPFVETGDLLARIHQDSLAVTYFQSALHLQPDYLPAELDLARLLLISDEPGRADPVWAADLFRQADEQTHGLNLGIKVERAAALATAKAFDAAIDVLQQAVAPDTATLMPPEDRERILQLIQKYQVASLPPSPQDASRGAPVAHPDETSIFQAYPAAPDAVATPETHFLPPP